MTSLAAPRRARSRSLLCLPAAALLTVGAAPSGGVLHVQVDNVRARTGRVHVDLCTQAQFLKDCPIAADSAAQVGMTTVTLRDLKPGRYAAQVYYDQNGNGKVDRALFGIPKEGVGFSNDAKIRMSPPKWEEAVFDYDGRERTIRLKLRYFLGPNAPAAQQ
ncbi:MULTISPECIES: DUF2141 domain-containing protein [unclassified Sphingomonas]|uniref:DUF2141 domain-containing protein n=1 Tax=unclassified Sphingomonas TaxID=196159 RepID=UPI001F588963|nr:MULTISPECIES: DUF2141 domain-containing protein [unclassified Sphingomonas]